MCLEKVTECQRIRCPHLKPIEKGFWCKEQGKQLGKFVSCRRFSVEGVRGDYFYFYKLRGGNS